MQYFLRVVKYLVIIQTLDSLKDALKHITSNTTDVANVLEQIDNSMEV